MKKITTLFTLLLCLFPLLGNAQLSFTTHYKKADGPKPIFLTLEIAKGESITVDWGDGSEVYTMLSAGEKIRLGHDFIDNAEEHTVNIDGIEKATVLTLISNKKISSVLLGELPYLKVLSVANNLLRSLDVSHLKKLEQLICNSNHLTSLSIPEGLTTLNCSFNDFAMSELPTSKTIKNYIYAPQHRYTMRNGQVKGLQIDLNNQLYVQNGNGGKGVKSTFTWYYKKNDQPLANNLYSYDNEGRFTFYTAPEGEIYCVISNPEFPKFTLNRKYITDFFSIQGTNVTLNNPILTLSADKYTTENLTANITLGASKNNSTARIAWGDGTIETYKLTATPIEVKHNFIDSKVDRTHNIAIEGDNVNYVKVGADFFLTAITAEKAKEQLNTLIIEGNNLGALNKGGGLALDAFSGLRNITLTGCHLKNIKLSPLAPLQKINLSNNALTTIEGVNLENLTEANLANNQLTELNWSNASRLTKLDLRNNQLTILSTPANLVTLYCQNNKLAPSQLPEKKLLSEYVYSPQQAFTIAENKKNKQAIDLSSEALLIGIAKTPQKSTFVWHSQTTNLPLIAGIEYTESEPGKFVFSLKENTSAYCTIESPAFPSEEPFRSQTITIPKGTSTKVLQKPESKFCYYVNAEGEVVIQTSSTEQVFILDIMGKCLLSFTPTVQEDKTTLHIATGTYLIKQGNETQLMLVER